MSLFASPPPSGLSHTGRPLRQRTSVAKYGSMVDSDIISDPEDDEQVKDSGRRKKRGGDESDEDTWGDEGQEDAEEEGSEDEFMDVDEDDEGEKKSKSRSRKSASVSTSTSNKSKTKVSSITQPTIRSAFQQTKPLSTVKSVTKPRLVPVASVKKTTKSKRVVESDDEAEADQEKEEKEDGTEEGETESSHKIVPAKRARSPTNDHDGNADEEGRQSEENQSSDEQGDEEKPPVAKSKPKSTISAPDSSAPLSKKTNSKATTPLPVPLAKKAKVGISLDPASSKASITSKASTTSIATTATKKAGFVPLKKINKVELAPAKSSGKGVVAKKVDVVDVVAKKPVKAKPAKSGSKVKKTTVDDVDEADDENKDDDDEADKNDEEDEGGKMDKDIKIKDKEDVSAQGDDDEGDEQGDEEEAQEQEEEEEEKKPKATKGKGRGKNAAERSESSKSNSTSRTSSTPTPSPKGKAATGADRKLAPPEKATPALRVAIIDALVDPAYTKHVDFQSLASSFNNDPNSSKLSRHGREVLSADLRAYARDGSMPGKKTKAAAKGGLGKEHRLAIWGAVCAKYDKADWARIEQESGMSTTKAKRHLRDVLRKDGEGVIKASG